MLAKRQEEELDKRTGKTLRQPTEVAEDSRSNAMKAQGGVMRHSNQGIPLGVPDQVNGRATAPIDRGDEMQERLRYQWAAGVLLLAQGFVGIRDMHALWCEHHEDYLIELASGMFVAVQVKTDSRENIKWKLGEAELVKSISRFCDLEGRYGDAIEGYEFLSNAPPYVPDQNAGEKSQQTSPLRLCEGCVAASDLTGIEAYCREMFDSLQEKIGAVPECLFRVLRKLRFLQGPVLRGLDDSVSHSVVPKLPGCANLPAIRCCQVRDDLISLVQGACHLKTQGVDGVMDYIASNGRPQTILRAKCITMDEASARIAGMLESTFRFVYSGPSLPLANAASRGGVLQRKMRNAYLSSQFEGLQMRVESAEQHLLARAGNEPDDFEQVAAQLQAVVLTECKDIEAINSRVQDEKRRGSVIYGEILERMTELAKHEQARVCHESKDTLMGIAGILSGECRFAWGVPLVENEHGS